MSTSDNKALVERFIKNVFQDLNADAVDDLVAPDFVSHTWKFTGDQRAALKAVTARMGALLSNIVFEVDDLIAEGDRVAARVTASATPIAEIHGVAPTGRRYSIGEIHIFRIANGKLAEHWHQYDLPGMISQLKGDEQTAAG
jgi:Predicted ester cyclase